MSVNSKMDNFTNVCEATSLSPDFDSIRPTHRKGKKLLAEKKRRARINNCLMQIRDLVCEGEEEKDTDLDKMEKAEILEKTLEVLTRLRHDYSNTSNNSFSAHKAMAVRYALGFSSCAEESIKYIQSSRLVPSEVKVQLQRHLREIARRMESTVQVDSQILTAPPASGPSSSMPSSLVMSPDRLGNDTRVREDLAKKNLSVPCHTPNDGPQFKGYYIPSPIHSSTPLLQHQATHSTTVPSSHEGCFTPPLDNFVRQIPVKESQISAEKQVSQFTDIPSSKHTPGKLPTADSIISSTQGSAFHRPETYSLEVSKDYPSTYSSLAVQPPHLPSILSMTAVTPPVTGFTSSPLPTTPLLEHQPLYSYHGYEPYPTVPSALIQPVTYVTTPLIYNQPAARMAKQSKTPANALDLCVKRNEHQISPETMWRPW